MAEIKLSSEQQDFFTTFAGKPVVCTAQPHAGNPNPKPEEWYYLKYWFRKIREEETIVGTIFTMGAGVSSSTPMMKKLWVMEYVTMDRLEPHVIKAIEAARDENPNFPYRPERLQHRPFNPGSDDRADKS